MAQESKTFSARPTLMRAYFVRFFILILIFGGCRSQASAIEEACIATAEKIGAFFRKQANARSSSAQQIQDGVLLKGSYELTVVKSSDRLVIHDDVFLGQFNDGKRFFFRNGRERSKREVAAYRFGKAAGFDVPATVYAEVNGMTGSAQAAVENLPLASDLKRGFAPNGSDRMNAATKIFDALLGMNDRHPGNFFVRPDGTQVLIDNEQMFWKNRSTVVLRDGQNEIVEVATIRNFIKMDPERARHLADPANESNFIWALRDLSEKNIDDFRGRLRLYRLNYRRLMTP